jgi:hypothetical protein
MPLGGAGRQFAQDPNRFHSTTNKHEFTNEVAAIALNRLLWSAD